MKRKAWRSTWKQQRKELSGNENRHNFRDVQGPRQATQGLSTIHA
jgi:hypothetical protein